MPFIIQHLIPEPQTLVTVTEYDSAQNALSLMVEHDFSQLPVVDTNRKYIGMITSDSILEVVSNLRVTPEKIKVSLAIKRIKPYRMEDDLSDLLKSLQDVNAIPIVGKKSEVTAVITSYDAAKYFRKRAEDIMLAEDIEATLKDFIESSHKKDDGEIDEEMRDAAIQAVIPSNKEYQNKFRNAIFSYIGQTTGKKPKVDESIFNAVFERYLAQPIEPKAFEDLSLYEFIQIFKNLWPQYSQNFNLEWEYLNHLLDDVRKTRNAIAHFREVTPQQRQQLKYCAELLDRHRPKIEITENSSYEMPPLSQILSPALSPVLSRVAVEAIRGFVSRRGSSSGKKTVRDNTITLDIEQTTLSPPAEEIESNDSRYTPLAIWLQSLKEDRIACTFQEIERIISDDLPPSARNNRSWWANDSVGHTQSIQWLDAGWRVSSVNISAERVVFSRIGERQSAYIKFFNQLQEQLKSIEGLTAVSLTNPQGRQWFALAVRKQASEPENSLAIIFSFLLKSRFRIEACINGRHQEKNKFIFDQLYAQKAAIESEFGATLHWERLDDEHGSRIAYYRIESSITDNPDKLAEIQNWAIEVLPKFYSALSDRLILARQKALEINNGESLQNED